MVFPTIAALAALAAVVFIFIGIFFWIGPDPELEERWALSMQTQIRAQDHKTESPSALASRLNARLDRMSFATRISTDLARANMPITMSEYALLTIGAIAGGFFLGVLLTHNFIPSLILAVVCYFIPGFYVSRRHAQRLKMFQEQLPDLLSLLVSSLRSGYGLVHAMGLVVQEMPAPASEEFGRVVREVGLGFSLRDALAHLVRRVDSDDLDLIITAINIQHEVGGNLAQILDTITVTIRERVRLKGEVQVMTASMRLTSYMLVGMPFLIGGIMFILNPDYMMGMFQPGWPILLPIIALIMMFVGFLLTRKVVDIDV